MRTLLIMAAIGMLSVTACAQAHAPGTATTGTASASRDLVPGSPSTAASSTRLASYARTQPGSAQSDPGSISGLVNCACGGLPAQDIYAISTDGARFYLTQTVPGQPHWTILGVPAGNYFIYAVERIVRDEQTPDASPRRFSSGYTKAIACGLTVECTDHSPIAVEVRPGEETTGPETFDWYADEFPLVPVAGPPRPSLNESQTSFPTAQDAAVYLGQLTTAAHHVDAISECPVNLACFSLVSSRSGTRAAYYVAMAGANNQLTSCGLYLIDSGNGWLAFDGRCRAEGVFPAVGASGAVSLGIGETGCVNVHESPSLSGRVVACLPAGTAVQIDDGPVYTPAGSQPQSNDYWWHVAGRGWMVQSYLIGA